MGISEVKLFKILQILAPFEGVETKQPSWVNFWVKINGEFLAR
jgi:hypothetical protein